MPCNSDYMEPNGRERELHQTAQLLEWLMGQNGKPVPAGLSMAAQDIYLCTNFVPELCRELNEMSPSSRQAMLHQPNQMSRDLAVWWDRHADADRQRIALKAEVEAQLKTAQKIALDKLSPDDVKALGIDYIAKRAAEEGWE